MTHDPRTEDDIYQSLEDSLTGKISKLTNFTRRSFNYVWTRAFASDLRELELRVLASELSGWVDYSGGPLTEDDLQDLGLEDVEPEELNQYLHDEQLKEFVKIVGIERLSGSRATGEVNIETVTTDDVVVPEGTVVGTSPDSDGTSFKFETTEDATAPAGVQTVAGVSIQAVEVGEDYNLPAQTIVRFDSPPIGVRGVINPASTTGGEGRESNDDLRERAKNAVAEQSGGGTVEGIKGFIVSNVEGVREGDVILEEFVDNQPPYVDVIVDGGEEGTVDDEGTVLGAIEESRPAAIRHNLVRPEVTQIQIDAAVNGTDVDVVKAESRLEEYLLELGISETYYQDEVIRQIMEADSDIFNVGQLDTFVSQVTNETFMFDSTQSIYRLEYTHNGEGATVYYEDGTIADTADYDFVKDRAAASDPYFDAIEWLGNNDPADGESFYVDYDVDTRASLVLDEEHIMERNRGRSYTYDSTEQDYELVYPPIAATVSVTDPEGTKTYTEGTDYDLVSVVGEPESDVFRFRSGRAEYKLDYSTEATSVSISDASGETYSRGSDYTLVDTDDDGIADTIRWDTTQSTPDADERFTVSYNRQNGVEQTIRWNTANTTPDDNEDFDVSYEQGVYELDGEATDGYDEILRDNSGDEYVEDTEYQFTDYTGDGELDAIEWLDGQARPDNNEEWYISYNTEGDIYFSNRQKADPGPITVTLE